MRFSCEEICRLLPRRGSEVIRRCRCVEVYLGHTGGSSQPSRLGCPIPAHAAHPSRTPVADGQERYQRCWTLRAISSPVGRDGPALRQRFSMPGIAIQRPSTPCSLVTRSTFDKRCFRVLAKATDHALCAAPAHTILMTQVPTQSRDRNLTAKAVSIRISSAPAQGTPSSSSRSALLPTREIISPATLTASGDARV